MGFNVRRFRTGADLLQQLGLDGSAVVDQLNAQGRGGADLAALSQAYGGMSGFGPAQLRDLLRRGAVSPNRLTPSPTGDIPSGYAPSPSSTFGNNGANLEGSLAAMFAGDPFARQQLEMALGGRIVPSSVSNNGFQIQPFAAGSSPSIASGGPSGAAATASNLLASFGAGGTGGGAANAFLAGLANVLGGGGSQGGNSFGFQNGGSSGNNGLASYGGGGSTGSVLGDPTLTVEDKVTLMIMMIMKQMDKQIEAQANYINSLQQQQQGGGKGGGGKGGGGGAPSIDVETMKLKRLIDKRSQMFDMLRQIIDKYNETAKNIIQSIGR